MTDPSAVPATTDRVEFTDEQLDRLGHWLSECLDPAAPLNERVWRSRVEWMVKGPTFQDVLADLMGDGLADAWEQQLRRVSFWHHAGLWDASCAGVPTDIHLTPPKQLEAKCRLCGFALVAMDSDGKAIHVYRRVTDDGSDDRG